MALYKKCHCSERDNANRLASPYEAEFVKSLDRYGTILLVTGHVSSINQPGQAN